MRGKVIIIKKLFVIQLFTVSLLTLSAEPYKPYPVLFIHGVGATSQGSWGAGVDTLEDGEQLSDWVTSWESTFSQFLDYMHPYATTWDEIDPSYTIPGDADPVEGFYPNKAFVEIINFDDNRGSLDPDPEYPDPYSGQGDELWHRIKEILDEYYGEGQWEENRNAKVILVGHSMGALATRQAIKEDIIYHNSLLVPHIDKVLTMGAPLCGSIWSTQFLRFPFANTLFIWHPISQLTQIAYEEIEIYVNSTLVPSFIELIHSDVPRDEALNLILSLYYSKFGSWWGADLLLIGGFTLGVEMLGPLFLGGGDYDMSFFSSFLDECGSYGAGSGIDFYSLRYRRFFDTDSDIEYKLPIPINIGILPTEGLTGSQMKSYWQWGLAAEGVLVITAIFNPLNWFKVGKGGLSLIAWYDWNCNSDFAVRLYRQDLNEASPEYNAKVRTYSGVIHGEEGRRWRDIRSTIEEPPRIYWDTLFASKFDSIDPGSGDSIFKDTVVRLGRGDPELGTYRPDSIFGRVYEYFLANCTVNLEINKSKWEPLTWENGEIGREGNKFVIRDIRGRNVFPGWNKLKATAVNMANQKGTDEFRFWYNPFLTYLSINAPLDEDCFQSSIDTSAVVYFSDTRSTLQAESLSVIFEDNVILDTAIVYPVEDSVSQHTLRVPLPTAEEGMYLMKAVGVNKEDRPAKSIIGYYVDDTPPEPLITLPLEEDSVVHSSRVEDRMPFVFTIFDNLDTIIYRPKNEEAFIEITDSLGNLVWTDTIGNDTTVAGCYYNIPERIYWNFKDSDSNKVTNSGKYNVIISCLDKAGNLGLDTSFFFLDNEPPEIVEIVSAFDSTLTSNENFIELEYIIDEDTKIELKWIDKNDVESSVREGYASPEPDTNNFFEGGDIYGNYLADGLYTLWFKAEDDVRNDTTYIEGIVQGDTLRVDRTPPSIYELYAPWLIGPDNTVNVYFKVSEDLDSTVNMGEVILKTYIDKSEVDTDTIIPGTSKIEIDTVYDILEYRNGVHKIIVTAEDRWGNINTRMTEIVKGTIGTKITLPEEGDTLGQGWATIRGLANDPDMYNSIPFGGFSLYYKQSSSSSWDSTRVIVPENLRVPGIPENEGNKPVTNISNLARWNTAGLSADSYNLLLKSWEEGDSLVLVDTVNVFIESEPMISPVISNFEVNISGGDTIFEPAEGDTVTASYVLNNKPADISFDVLNESGRNMTHLEQKGIMAVSSSPPSMERAGLYLYFYNNKWWVKWRFDNIGLTSGEIFSLENESFSITEISDTIVSLMSPSEGKIIFNCINISDTVYKGGFGFTAEGKIQFDLSFNEGKDVGVAGSKLRSPFVLDLASPFLYDGTKFGEGHIPGGRYAIRVSARGIDGMGYDDESDTITTETNLKITKCELTSDIAYPLDTFPATVEYIVNQKAAVGIDVYKDDEFLVNVENIDSVAGGRRYLTSWMGTINDVPVEYGEDYKFKITAYNLPDSSDSDSVFSTSFKVLSSIRSNIGDFFIHPDYYVGEIHNDSVYNGKTDFLWEASASGEVYPPQEYTFVDTAKGIREITIDWKIEAEAQATWGEGGNGIVDSAVGMVGTGDTTWFYLDYVYPGDNPSAPIELIKYEYNAAGIGGCVALDENALDPYEFCEKCAGGSPRVRIIGPAAGESYIQADKRGIEKYCIEAYNLGSKVYATHHFPYPVDTIFFGSKTILGNSTTEEFLGPLKTDLLPDFLHPELPQQFFTYKLTTIVDGNTKDTTISTSDPVGTVDLYNNNVVVQMDFGENEVIAWIADPSDSSTKWIEVAERNDTCYPLSDGGGYNNDITQISDLFVIPPDVDQNTVSYSEPVLLSGNVNIRKIGTGKASYILARVSGWNPYWVSENDSLLTNGEIKGKGRFATTPGFIRDCVGEEFTFSDFYSASIDTQNIPRIFFSILFRKRGILPDSSGYVQTDWVQLSDTLSPGEYTRQAVYFDYDPPEGTYAESLLVAGIIGDSVFTESVALEKMKAEWYAEKGGMDIAFGWLDGQDPDLLYARAYNHLLTFWENGDAPNDYLDIEDWYFNLSYPNGEINTDLFVDPLPYDDMRPDKALVGIYGYGEGDQDYFHPYHFMFPVNVPRKYVEIDGHSKGKYYRMYEFDGRDMKEISNKLMDPVDSLSTSTLAYWNVTDVCGKRRVIMKLYRAPGRDPEELRYKDFYIGSPYNPGENSIASSPFYRANLQFNEISFPEETLTSVSPVSINDMLDELSYESPLLGEYKGPIVLLQPKGAKFEGSEKPTFKYYYTEEEAAHHGLDPSNISLFAIKDNGFLQDITSSAFWDFSTPDSLLTLEASPEEFPGKGDSPFLVSLLDFRTASYKPTVTSVSATNIDSAKIHVSTKPNKELLLIRSGKDESSQSSTFKTAATSAIPSPLEKRTENIYSAIEAFKNQTGRSSKSLSAMSTPRWDINEVDTMSIDVGSDGMWEGYVHLEGGDNYIFVGHREALLYALTPADSLVIRNCPIGFTKITLDITGPEIVFTRDPDPLISHMDDMESIAFYPTENAFIHYVKFNTGGEIDDARSFYSLAYDTTIIYWDGKDEYGRLYKEGIYPYVVFGIDDFGNKSNEEKHQWEIRWGIPVEIVSPRHWMWLKGMQTLWSRIEGDYTYPVDWYKKWDGVWGYIGREDPSGEGLDWNTTFLPDEKRVWLKASVEDVFGHIGVDSVRVRGIDNHPPEIYTWVGEPSYRDEFISGLTPIFATAVDTFSGVDFFRYQIDGGSSANLRDTFNLAGYSDGRHQIVFSARDYTDNDTAYSLSLYLDDTPPFSQIVFGEPKKMHNDTLYISPSTPIWIEAQDTCGIAHSFYNVFALSGIEIQPWTEAIGDFNIPYTPPYYRYIISYYSEDHLGNTESPRDTVVAVDCEPPVTVLNIGDPRYPLPSDSSIVYITSETPLSFEATDDISGVDTTYYRIDGTAWNVYSGGEFTLAEEGSHIVEYYSVDKAGNREDINSKELRVDNTHPLSQLTTGTPNYEFPDDSLQRTLITSNTPLILTAEDPLSNGVASGVKELEYEIASLPPSGSPISAVIEGDSTEFTITGEDGSYKVDYRARDNVLNEEPFNSKYYELDNTPPVAIILSPLDSTMVSHTITIIGTVTDKHFKEYVLEYGEGIDPGDWNTITVSDKEVEDSVLGKLNVSCIPGNIITVRLRATDLVENEAVDEVILWKGDLICEFDIPLHKPEGVDFDNEGNIYATDRKGGKKKRCTDRDKVKKFDPFGTLIYEIPNRYVPNDVAVTPWGNILISEQVRKEITEFNQSQEYLRSIRYLKGPDGVDVTQLPDSGLRCKDKEKGELKGLVIGVADQTANKVILYDSLFRKAKEIKIIHERTLCYHHPEGISFDKQGNVYTCLINNDVVRKYDLDGNMLMQITGFNKPSDVEVDYRGYIWVTDRNNNRIRCFDAYGNHLFKYGKKGKGCGEFNKPEGIAVNHERMYVADMNNDRVQVLRFPFSVRFPTLSSIGKTRQEALSIQECVPYPNPCDPAIEFSNIRVVVNRDCEIEIRIYSLTGTLLWETAVTGFAGINEVTWNGMNQNGEEVRNGVYNVLVRAKDESQKDEERTKIIVYKR